MITLEAYVYPRISTGLRLSYGRLGAGALTVTTPVEDAFRLTVSRLGAGFLGAAGAVRTWQAIPGLTRVTASRGMSAKAGVLAATAGTLSATLSNNGDPDTYPGLGAGTPIRLSDTTLGVIWVGRLADVTLEWSKDATADYVATWYATDLVADLVAQVAGVPAHATIGARVTYLTGLAGMTSTESDIPIGAPETPRVGGGLRALPLGATTPAHSIAQHLDIALATVRGGWWPARDTAAAVRYGIAHSRGVQIAWSDVTAPSYTGIDAAWSTADVVNSLEVTNEPTGTVRTVSDPTSIAANGTRAGTVSLAASTDADAVMVGTDYLRTSTTPRLVVASLIAGKPAAATSLGMNVYDIFAMWSVALRGRTALVRVARITYDITADATEPSGARWKTTYQLTPA